MKVVTYDNTVWDQIIEIGNDSSLSTCLNHPAFVIKSELACRRTKFRDEILAVRFDQYDLQITSPVSHLNMAIALIGCPCLALRLMFSIVVSAFCMTYLWRGKRERALRDDEETRSPYSSMFSTLVLEKSDAMALRRC